ncbi:hypothetical protein BJ742DRAFT_810136 [Cladochytrium replicatum]|nr:hypothetical protein BJ742DRAFT_810136 [Cladochytrium replicatum]
MSGGRRAQSAVASVTTADRRARFGAPSSSSSTGSTLDALDWFDRYSLVSKQLGADADNNPRHSLKVRSVQEEFYAKILEEEAKMGRTEKVVAAFRKLREGVTSSNIHDEFAIKVYEHSVDVCLDVDDSTGELIKSLAQLIGTIYPGAEAHIPETNPDKNHSLTRRSEMSKLYLLYVISTPPTQVPTEPRRPSTAPPSRPQSARDPQLPRRPLHGDINEIMKIYRALPTHIRETEDVQFAMDIFWVLRSDLDYVRFGMLWRKMGTREKTIMKIV